MLLLNLLKEFWLITNQMAPWLLFGFLMAGVLSIVFSPSYVKHHLGGKGLWPTIKAAILGVPLPLCSCGVVPVALSLKKQGAGRGATASFLISTPQTGVDSFIVTWSMLGWVFAAFKVVTAFITGIIGGAAVEYLDSGYEAKTSPASSGNGEEKPKNRFVHIFRYGFVTLFDDVAGTLLVGLLIAAVIGVAMPPEWLSGYHGSELVSMLIMLVVGIPLYVCSTASVPIAAALMLKGISPGAALVFLIAGPATNAATITAIATILGRKAMVIYLTVVATLALAAGAVLNLISGSIPGGLTAAPFHDHNSLQQWAGAVLLALIALSFLRRWYRKWQAGRGESCCAECHAASGTELKLSIGGITCDHCRQSAEAALRELPGVTAVKVMPDGTATLQYQGEPPDRARIETVLREAGFELR